MSETTDKPVYVTAAIVKAMERASECDAAIVVMEKKDGGLVLIGNDDLSVAGATYMLEAAKLRYMLAALQ